MSYSTIVEPARGPFHRPGWFELIPRGTRRLEDLLRMDPYALARAFVRREFDVAGDVFAAVRATAKRRRAGLQEWVGRMAAGLASARMERLVQTRSQAARNIRFHYDRSNAFYEQFLDPRMVYSCAYFREPGWTLERAQLEKLDLICRKLGLQAGQRFLDIGCGWGALVLHAAERYGADAHGCTLSDRQFEWARARAARGGAAGAAHFYERDYRDMEGRFDRIASVGMFEHVGRRRMRQYFKTVAGLLEDDGRFLNHGIVRPVTEPRDAETAFLQRVFPGGELVHLPDVCEAAERAGFEVIDVENLRPHYALTCRAWVAGLEARREECIRLAGEETYRTWLLYLAGSAVNFEDGHTDIYQILFEKRSHPLPRRMSRDYLFEPKAGEDSVRGGGRLE